MSADGCPGFFPAEVVILEGLFQGDLAAAVLRIPLGGIRGELEGLNSVSKGLKLVVATAIQSFAFQAPSLVTSRASLSVFGPVPDTFAPGMVGPAASRKWVQLTALPAAPFAPWKKSAAPFRTMIPLPHQSACESNVSYEPGGAPVKMTLSWPPFAPNGACDVPAASAPPSSIEIDAALEVGDPVCGVANRRVALL